MTKQVPMEESGDSSNGRGVLATLVVALLPLIGGILYVSLRGSYVRVYDRFGITPEDVGVNSYVVLTGAYRILFLGNWRPFQSTIQIVLLRLLIYVFPLVLLLLLWRLGQSKQWRLLKWAKGMPWLRIVWLYILIVLIVIWFVFQFTIGTDVQRAIDRIQNGQPVRPGDFSYLGVQAYPAAVQSVDGHMPPATVPKNQMLLYLGHADNHIILYNPCTDRTWRIPDETALAIMGRDRHKIPCSVPSSAANMQPS